MNKIYIILGKLSEIKLMINFLPLEVINLTLLLSEIPRKINSESVAFHVEKRRDSAPYAEEDVVPCEIGRLSGCERDIVFMCSFCSHKRISKPFKGSKKIQTWIRWKYDSIICLYTCSDNLK